MSDTFLLLQNQLDKEKEDHRLELIEKDQEIQKIREAFEQKQREFDEVKFNFNFNVNVNGTFSSVGLGETLRNAEDNESRTREIRRRNCKMNMNSIDFFINRSHLETSR